MGIDIYARWRGQTARERRAQITGFSVIHGSTGYLREAYHGEPYATQYLCREAFASERHEATIAAATLRERLPHTLNLVEQREREVYGETNEADIEMVKESFRQFVELCERKEAETGEPCLIVASY